jgi:hypothetical protein
VLAGLISSEASPWLADGWLQKKEKKKDTLFWISAVIFMASSVVLYFLIRKLMCWLFKCICFIPYLHHGTWGMEKMRRLFKLKLMKFLWVDELRVEKVTI